VGGGGWLSQTRSTTLRGGAHGARLGARPTQVGGGRATQKPLQAAKPRERSTPLHSGARS
jgi:hypothetical protein